MASSASAIVFASISSLALLGACGDDPKQVVTDAGADASVDAAALDAFVPDARPAAALDCLGDPSPTTADATVTLMANAFNIGLAGQTPVEGATVEALLTTDPTGDPVATAISAANGDAPLAIDTGGVPQSLFVRATPADTYLTSELFFPDVVAVSTPAPAILLDTQTIGLLGMASGQSQDFATNGFGVVLVLDCAGAPIFGAEVATPSGTVVYMGENGTPDTSLTATSGIGTAFVFNITPGEDLLFDAMVDGMSLRDNTARAVLGQVVSLAIQP